MHLRKTGAEVHLLHLLQKVVKASNSLEWCAHHAQWHFKNERICQAHAGNAASPSSHDSPGVSAEQREEKGGTQTTAGIRLTKGSCGGGVREYIFFVVLFTINDRFTFADGGIFLKCIHSSR